MSPHHWRMKECKYCGNWSLEKTCYLCRITWPKPLKRQKEEDQKVDGFKIEPFSNIGSKY
jgi:hypothetical protein